MALILFAFWVLLNGSWTTEIAVTGVVLCALVYLFIWKFMGYSPRVEWALARRAGKALGYFVWLVGQILASAWATVRLIWSPWLEVEPVLKGFRSRLKTESGRVMLADSITLTPGTITIAVQEDRLLVHCLDQSLAEGLEDSEMERRLLRVEGDGARG